ncbi:MAG TPA: peptidoglycan DD-metalloendopeptidase family protein [Thermoanaerobaculia bacterium]|nr:peptidoglycan DD-metalloendopeptidase family protein [Thermoanaerobaculia bacterium]
MTLSERGERILLALAASGAALLLSLWITVPSAAARALRRERAAELVRDTADARAAGGDLEARVRGLRDRAADAGSLASRVAFLYGVPPADWPRGLKPESGLLAPSEPRALTEGIARYAAALDHAAEVLEGRERAAPGLAAVTPSVLPLTAELVEPSAVFGPRVSPWTGAEEFFDGLDLAAPAGTPVIAPADGTVLFTGRVAPSPHSRLSRFGTLVVLGHGPAGGTLFGHLGRLDVRRGQRVRRGERLGAVGNSGWAMAPTLHYELWRRSRGGLAPTDPRFAVLDRKLIDGALSLERMLATSSPEPGETPPGL